MYSSLLVPLDGSAFGEHALPVALGIARRTGAALHLVRVHLPMAYVPLRPGEFPDLEPWNRQVRERESTYLEELARRIERDCGIRASSALLDEPVAEAISGQAEAVGADLIVLTTHGRTGLSRAWLGSVADALIRHATTPALLVRPTKVPHDLSRERRFEHLLVAIDGSGFAEQILPHAAALAAVEGARCTLLRVVVPAAAPVEPYPRAPRAAAVDRRVVDASVAHAEDALRVVAERLRGRGIEADVEVRVHERPARAILRRAQTGGVDCIAMAVHGRGASRLLLGSVADKVLRGSSLPMLLHRPRAEGNEARQDNEEL